LILLLCAALVAGASQVARGQEGGVAASFAAPQKEAVEVNVRIGQSRVITFDRAISRFSVSNPDIAEAVLVSPEQVVVNGKAFGQINFIAWAKDTDRYIVFDVVVRMNLSALDAQMRVLFPNEDVRLSQANGSVIISGRVSDPKRAERVEAVVQAAGFKTVNMLELPVQDTAQVQLQVRVAEVSRTRMRELGTSYAYQGSQGAGGYLNSGAGPSTLGDVQNGLLSGTIADTLNLFVMGGNTMSFLRALKQQGALRSLAEPNLIAMNGQQASFLAGGEFPIPVVQGGGQTDRTAVTIVFKEYGVRLNFKPTIIDEDHIRLEMEPEVSTIDFANGVKFEGFTIPALKTRRAKTGVELRDGQSFALAGLLDNSEVKSLSKVPGLGDIPVLGALFRSKSFQKNETELMFIVTAQIVKPVNRDDLPRMRGIDGLKEGSPLGVEPKGEGIEGASGYSTGATTVSPVAQAAPSSTAEQAAPFVPPSATTEQPPALPAKPKSGGAPAPAAPEPKKSLGADAKAQPAAGAKVGSAP
jgi:pilus assembly protein CpaC